MPSSFTPILIYFPGSFQYVFHMKRGFGIKLAKWKKRNQRWQWIVCDFSFPPFFYFFLRSFHFGSVWSPCNFFATCSRLIRTENSHTTTQPRFKLTYSISFSIRNPENKWRKRRIIAIWETKNGNAESLPGFIIFFLKEENEIIILN